MRFGDCVDDIVRQLIVFDPEHSFAYVGHVSSLKHVFFFNFRAHQAEPLNIQ